MQEDILKGRFARRVFKEVADSINKEVAITMTKRGFKSPFWKNRSFQVSDSALQYQHPITNRFVDLKKRNKGAEKVNKKFHPVHNRILFGHQKEIIKQFSFGFTNAVREQLRTIAEEKEI